MHHVALDRTGPHDRHLDHQVVETARLQARQHAICARDSIWNTPMVSARQIMSRRRGSFGGMSPQRRIRAAVAIDQIEAALQRREHAERQHVDLEQSEAFRSSLSHWMTVRSGIAAFSTGTRSSSASCGDHEAADVLRQMARKAG